MKRGIIFTLAATLLLGALAAIAIFSKTGHGRPSPVHASQAGTKAQSVAGMVVVRSLTSPKLGPLLNRYCGVSAITVARNGDVWIAGRHGVDVFRAATGTWERFSPDDALPSQRLIAESGDGRIWALGLGDRVSYLDERGWHSAQAPPLSAALMRHYRGYVNYTPFTDPTAMFATPSGAFILVRDDGILVYDAGAWRRVVPPAQVAREYDGLAPPSVKGEVQLTRWQVRTYATVANLRHIGVTLTQPPGPLPETYCGAVAADGSVWLGTDRAAVRVDLSNGTWQMYPLPAGIAQAAACYQSHDGLIWVADKIGDAATLDAAIGHWVVYNLYELMPPDSAPRREPQTGPPSMDIDPRLGAPPSKPYPRQEQNSLSTGAIYEDATGRMLFGVQMGLAVFDPRNEKCEFFDSSNSAVQGSVTCFATDRAGQIWMGIAGGILILQP